MAELLPTMNSANYLAVKARAVNHNVDVFFYTCLLFQHFQPDLSRTLKTGEKLQSAQIDEKILIQATVALNCRIQRVVF